jgi:hypothetical protein
VAGVKQLGCEADHSLAYTADMKKKKRWRRRRIMRKRRRRRREGGE